MPFLWWPKHSLDRIMHRLVDGSCKIRGNVHAWHTCDLICSVLVASYATTRLLQTRSHWSDSEIVIIKPTLKIQQPRAHINFWICYHFAFSAKMAGELPRRNRMADFSFRECLANSRTTTPSNTAATLHLHPPLHAPNMFLHAPYMFLDICFTH